MMCVTSAYRANVVVMVFIFCGAIVSSTPVVDFDDDVPSSGDAEDMSGDTVVTTGETVTTADWLGSGYDISDYNYTHWNTTDLNTTSFVTPNVSRGSAVSGNLVCGYVISMSERFLEHVIQPHYVTEMADDVDLRDYQDIRRSMTDDHSVWLTYFVGYYVSVVLVAVIIVVVSVVAIAVSCCRCHGHCGGDVHPLEGKHALCLRVSYIAAIFVVMCFAIVFLVCAFDYADRVRYRLRTRGGYADEISRGFTDIDAFLDRAVVSLHNDVIGTFDQYMAAMFARIWFIPQRVHDALVNASDLHETQNKLRQFEEELTSNVVGKLAYANLTIASLHDMASTVHESLSLLKINLTDALVNVTVSDDTTKEISLLGTGSNFTDIDVSSALRIVNRVIADGTVGKANDWISETVDTIRSNVDSTTRSMMQDVDEEASLVRFDLAQLVNDVGQSARRLNLKAAADRVQAAKPSISLYADITYSFMIAASVIISIVLFCKLIGLLYGAFCRRTGTYEKSHFCEVRRTTGATWLIASVALTTLFCAFVLIVACALFIAAGVAHTEVCRHVTCPRSPSSARVLRVMNDLLNNSVFGSVCLDVNLTRLYSRCEQDAPLYDAADMMRAGNDIMSMRSVEHAIARFATLPLTVHNISPLAHDQEADIINLKRSLTLLDLRELRQRLRNRVSSVELYSLLGELKDIANDTGTDLADNIRELHSIINHIVRLRQTKVSISDTFNHLSNSLSQFPVSDVFDSFNFTESFLKERGSGIVFEIVNHLVVMALSDAGAAHADVTKLILTEGARCRPMYESMSRMVNVTCSGIVAPLNGFWFSIAVCMLLLLLPCATPLSLALATQLRKRERHHPAAAAAVFSYEHAYDAYRISDYSPAFEQSRDRLVVKAPSRERLDSVDNPVYLIESNVPPRLAHRSEQPCPPGYPRFGALKTSPPPSYESSAVDDYEIIDDDDRSTYDTRL